MPSTNKTPKLGLNNWVGTDKPKRADFVADNTVIDAALGGHVENAALHLTAEERLMLTQNIVTNTFQGTGGEEGELTLGFEPKAIFVFRMDKPPVELSGGTAVINFAAAGPFLNTGGIQLDGSAVYLTQTQGTPGAGQPRYDLNVNRAQYAYFAFR